MWTLELSSYLLEITYDAQMLQSQILFGSSLHSQESVSRLVNIGK